MNNLYCPKLLEDTVVIKQRDAFVFFVPSKPDWVKVDANGAKLLSLCDGTRTLDEIRKELNEHPNIEDAINLLNDIHEKGFFTPQAIDPTAIRKRYLHSLHLNMTEKCNLQCEYCYAEERELESDTYLSMEDYKRVVDEIYEFSPHVAVTFTGGEPLLNPLTLDVARYCKDKSMNTFLLTNGTLINENNAPQIAKLFDTIRISVDGSNADMHDSLRGKGSYSKTMNGIKLLEGNGAKPLISMTVTSKNIDDIEDATKLFGNRLNFQPLYQLGNARGKGLEISGEEYFNALKNAKGVAIYGGIADEMNTLRNSACGRCAIGDGEISISATGNVYPCHMLHLEQFCTGNVKEKSFCDIYAQSEILKEIRKLTTATRAECSECIFRFLCCGGCWARAFFEDEDLNKADPFCDYEFLAFREAFLEL